MRTPLVSLRDVSAGYDGKVVLSDVSLDIYSGDFMGITGPNGGGKTTLLKIIMGLLPHFGTVEYSDSLMVSTARHQNETLHSKTSPHSKTSSRNKTPRSKIPRIGYLPQQSVFDRSFPISVIDVVVSGLQADKGFTHRYTRAEFTHARKLLKMTGISDIERRPVGELSGGQMQRALLCRALIVQPKLLILDEPTTYIDNHFESELYGLLRELNDSGMAIVMVSHTTTTLADIAERVVHVDGTVRC